MASQVLFAIISDDPDRALRDLFGCSLADCPPFVLATDDIRAISAIEDGTGYQGQWYSERRRAVIFPSLWDRRMRGGIQGISLEDMDRIRDWIKRRDARRADNLASVNSSSSDSSGRETAPTLSQRWI